VLEKLYTVATVSAGSASLSLLLVIGVNRYIAIKKLLRNQDIVTKLRLKIAVLLTWAFIVFLVIQETVWLQWTVKQTYTQSV